MTKTAAERQKTYRDNKRNATITEPVAVTFCNVRHNAPVTENVTRTVTESPESVTGMENES